MRHSMVLGLVAALSASSLASAYDEPRELVDAIYQPYISGGTHTDLGPFLSSRLRQLFADHAEKLASEVEVTGSIAPAQAATAIDFNPFIDGQNALLLDVAIGTPVVIGDQALVTVAFHNFDQPTLLSLSLVREGDGWKVDDVTSTGGEENWMLSWLLQYDPWGL